MQLSAPTTSADLILATLAAPKPDLGAQPAPGAAPGEPASAAVGDATGFAQLFPGLASAQPSTAAAGNATGFADVFADRFPATAEQPANATALAAALPFIASDTQPEDGVVSADEMTTAGRPSVLAETRAGVRAPAVPRSARHIATARSATVPRVAAEASSLAPAASLDRVATGPAPSPVLTTEPVTAELAPGSDSPAQPDRDERGASLPMPAWIALFAADGSAPELPETSTAPAQHPPGTFDAPTLARDASLVTDLPANCISPTIERAAPLAPFARLESSPPPASRIAVPAAPQSAGGFSAALPTRPMQVSAFPSSSSAATERSASPSAIPPSAGASASDVAIRTTATVADALVSSGAARPAIASGPVAPPSRRRDEENIAALIGKNPDAEISPRTPLRKTFLSAAAERLASDPSDLGIAVAKSPSPMPALAFNDRSAPAAVLSHAAPASAVDAPLEAPAPAAPLFAPAAPAAAHRAVEAVLNAAERFSTGERQSVNLQFSVGGADLAVRVELRADEVRATFRTDSAELRSALAHEWQAVSADTGARPFRLAAPVFTSNSADSSGLAGFAGDNAPRQRDANPRRTAGEVFASVASRARAVAASAAGEVALPNVRLGSLPTSLHLHTLA